MTRRCGPWPGRTRPPGRRERAAGLAWPAGRRRRGRVRPGAGSCRSPPSSAGGDPLLLAAPPAARRPRPRRAAVAELAGSIGVRVTTTAGTPRGRSDDAGDPRTRESTGADGSHSGLFRIASRAMSTWTVPSSQLMRVAQCGATRTFLPNHQLLVSTTRYVTCQVSSSTMKSSTWPIASSLPWIRYPRMSRGAAQVNVGALLGRLGRLVLQRAAPRARSGRRPCPRARRIASSRGIRSSGRSRPRAGGRRACRRRRSGCSGPCPSSTPGGSDGSTTRLRGTRRGR